jgi:hypothetical protein
MSWSARLAAILSVLAAVAFAVALVEPAIVDGDRGWQVVALALGGTVFWWVVPLVSATLARSPLMDNGFPLLVASIYAATWCSAWVLASLSRRLRAAAPVAVLISLLIAAAGVTYKVRMYGVWQAEDIPGAGYRWWMASLALTSGALLAQAAANRTDASGSRAAVGKA